MTSLKWFKGLLLTIHSPGIGAAFIILAITQMPLAIKAVAELACIGESSNLIWKHSNSHKGVNMMAVNHCNGGNSYHVIPTNKAPINYDKY